MYKRIGLRLLACVGAVLLCTACSDDDTSNTVDSGGNGDAAMDAGCCDSSVESDGAPDQGVKGPMTITVMKVDSTRAKAPEAFADVVVAATLPSGEVVEKRTGSDGKVVFEDVEWSAGTAAATAYAPGYVMESFVGISAANSAETLYLIDLPPTDTVTVSGVAKNTQPGFDRVSVTHSGHVASFSETNTGNYALSVEKGAPFSIVAVHAKNNKQGVQREIDFDVLGWTNVDSTGVSADATIDLDFANVLTLKDIVSSTFVLPTDTSSPLYSGSFAVVGVTSFESAMTVGLAWTRSTKLEAGGKEFVATTEVVELPGATRLLTRYSLALGGGSFSSVNVAGAPVDGARIDGFLEVPELVWPASGSETVRLFSRMELTAKDDKVHVGVGLLRDGVAVWRLSAPPGTTRLWLPEPPAAANLEQLLGKAPLDAGIVLCEREATNLICGKYATTVQFKVSTVDTVAGVVDVRGADPAKPLEGVKICMRDDSSVPCVNTDAEGKYTLAGVSQLKRGMLSMEKSGYETVYVSIGRRQENTDADFAMSDDSQVAKDLAAVGVTAKAGTGKLVAFVQTTGGALKKATFKLDKAVGDGPFYLDENEAFDKSLTETTGVSGAAWVNVPPGKYVMTIETDDPTMTCTPHNAWGSGAGKRFEVEVFAGAMTATLAHCQ